MSITTKPVTRHDAVIALPFCHLGITFNKNALLATEYMLPGSKTYQTENKITKSVIEQLNSYIQNPEHRFELDLELKGTEFQLRVWNSLREIQSGKTLTYGDLAEQLSSSARAVGNACRANPLPLLIPCHRVVAATGLGGFAGSTSGYHIEIKRQLLRHEGLVF